MLFKIVITVGVAPVITLQRLYKSGKNDDMHRYTLHSDDPDFVRAKINAQQISDVSPALLDAKTQHLKNRKT